MTQKMNLFLDTEFSRFPSPDERLSENWPRKVGLISLAIVAENESEHFYAVLSDTWEEENCTRFVKENVLRHLAGEAAQPIAEARQACIAWLEKYKSEKIIFWSDAPSFDWPLFKFFIGGTVPEYVQPYANMVTFRNTKQLRRYEAALADERSRPGHRDHHALDDARAICRSWKAMLGR